MSISIDLSGKNALVTGGTRGIGRVISRRLAQAGARIGMIFRGDEEAANAAVRELEAIAGNGHFALPADLSDREAASRAVRESIARFGGALDILVLNAGIGTAAGPFAELSFEQWQRPFDVNVNGHVAMLQAAYPAVRPDGSVVVISSGAGHDPLEGLSAYGASKAALNHLAGILAQEWGPRGIRVNVVSPGATAKEAPNYADLSERQKEGIAATALRRLGTADDVADVVLFFASGLSSFVTGQWVRVNGGRV